jgi:hypothetical protein
MMNGKVKNSHLTFRCNIICLALAAAYKIPHCAHYTPKMVTHIRYWVLQQLTIIPKSSATKLGKITLLSLAPTEIQVVAHPASFYPF